MIEAMDESGGNMLAIRATGVIRRIDYDALTPMCETIINRYGSMRLLIDMQGFELEAPGAWRADFHFGREFHNKIERMAIVGDKRWEAWMTDFCRHFYARDARFFNSVDAAWDWLREEAEAAA